jgi:hypothetical protein
MEQFTMADQWEFYPSQVDGMSASIYVNLSYREFSRLAHANQLAWMSIRFLQQREDGLSHPEEFESLCAIEDACIDKLEEGGVEAHYVGRNTSQGGRDYFFYTSDGSQVEKLLCQAMVQFPDYEYEVGHRQETDWSTYQTFLLPSPRDMQLIQNEHVIRKLEESNDLLTTPRTVLHWIYFSDHLTRENFVEKSLAIGFTIDHRIEPNADNQEWGVVLARQHPVDYWSIADVTLTLFDLASEFGGVYDGWETPVVTSPANFDSME